MTEVIDLESRKKRGRADEPKPEFSAELIADARDMGIEEWAIRQGGDYRQLGGGKDKKIYWLSLPQLLEFEQKDIDIESDQEFFDWFRTFAEDSKLQTKAERTKKETRHWDDWDRKFDWKPKKISDWWNDYGYNRNWDDGWSGKTGGSHDSAVTKKLALALKAITTTVSVINDTGKRYRVRFNSEGEGPGGYTSFNEQAVVISPAALLDTSIETAEGIEITTGWALHEASHVKYSASLLDALTKPSELKPVTLAHRLWNIIEDTRIEKLTAEKFPGFAEYFTTHNKYLWDLQADKMPKEWGPELTDKLNALMGMVKWADEYKPTCDTDPKLTEEFPWWQEWRDQYTSGKEDVRMAVIRALEHLAEDEETQQQMEDLTKQEDEQRQQSGQSGTPLTDEQFRQMMDDLKELLKNGIDPCPSPNGPGQQGTPIELTESQAQELEDLITEQYQQFEAFYKMKEGNTEGVGPTIEVMKPQEDSWSKDAYERPGSMVERLKSVFFFRKLRITENERLLKTGFVDEEQLWRVGVGDDRVFERWVEPEETNTAVTMLVDVSGSMIGEGIEKAQYLANVMLACLRTMRGVSVRVRAHSTGYENGSGPGSKTFTGGQTSKVYRIWEQGDPDTRIGLLTTVDHGSNFDGFAIDWCAQELDQVSADSKLLIVLSDGLPAGSFVVGGKSYHYGGVNAMNHMMEVSRQWESRGVTIVQIAIDQDGLRPEDQEMMFRHWIGYESDGKLLTDLTALLSTTFGAVE